MPPFTADHVKAMLPTLNEFSLEPITAAAVAGIVAFAFFVRGVSGFGSATIAIPMLVHVISLKLAVPLLLVLDFVSTLATLRIDRTLVDKREIRWLIPFGVVGVITGVTLLVQLPPALLLGGLGCVIVYFGIRALINPHGDAPVSRLWGIPAGFVGGLFGGMFGSGAATPYMIYLTHRLHDKRRVRATFTGFAFFDYGFRLITFAVTGLLIDAALGVLLLLSLPAMAIGQYAGNRVHHRISDAQARRIIGTLLVVGGLSLLAKSLT
jgi:uncharacterized membrane protein YfcA